MSAPATTSPASSVTLDDVQRIESQVALLFHHIRSMRRSAASRIDPELQAAAYVVLQRLVNAGPARASELVDYFGLDKAAVSRHVAHLQSLGLADRITDPDDRRAQIITATAEARRRCKKEQARRHALLQKHLSAWTPDQVRMFGDLLEQFNTASDG
jgi:DNA-binding MarR family transcriptional regulator